MCVFFITVLAAATPVMIEPDGCSTWYPPSSPECLSSPHECPGGPQTWCSNQGQDICDEFCEAWGEVDPVTVSCWEGGAGCYVYCNCIE